jgi:cell division protein FtsB
MVATVSKWIYNVLSRYGVFVVFIFLCFSLIGNILRIASSNGKVRQARDNLVNLEKENQRLKEELQIVNSVEFKEKEARDKLGLAKEGDVIVVLPPPEVIRKFAPERKETEKTLPDPNWKKWVKLFM